MTGLADERERLGAAPHVERRHRRGRELPALERRDGLADELAQPLRSGPEQIDARVAHPGMRRGEGVGVADVGHPELQEPPAARQESKRRVDELAGEAVEHDVDRLEALPEVRRPRRGEVLVVDPEGSQRIPLRGARGREHLGAEGLREPDGREPDTAGGSVDQDPLARLKLREIDERAARRGVRDGNDRRLRERPPLGHRHDRARVGHREGTERPVHEPHDAVAVLQARHTGADLDDDPRALQPELGRAGVDAHRDEDVAEVHARRAHGDADLAARQRAIAVAVRRRRRDDRARAFWREPPRA